MENLDKLNKKSEKEILKNAKQEIKKIEQKLNEDIKNCDDKGRKNSIIKNSYKRYSKIYLLYGKNAYIQCVPQKIRNKDVDELFMQCRFIEIYEKHGDKVFKDIVNDALKTDVEEETGSKLKGRTYFIAKSSKDVIKKLASIFTTIVATFTLGGNMLLIEESESRQKESLIENAKEVQEYVDSIKQYGTEVRQMDLTDTENIMKVIDDMWGNIQGYGKPKKDVIGCLGLDMFDKNGIGVCRNMADDCARKLNEINPDYDARIIAVDFKVNNADDVKLAKIKRNIIEHENNKVEEILDNGSNIDTIHNKVLTVINGMTIDKQGNHAVIIMDISQDNTTLVVDPTNPSIGVYKDGKVKMFNSVTEDGIDIQRRIVGDEILKGNESYNFVEEYLKSFLPCGLTDEELEEKYGVDAQNKALDKIENINGKDFIQSVKDYYMNKDEYIYKQDNNKIKQEEKQLEQER